MRVLKCVSLRLVVAHVAPRPACSLWVPGPAGGASSTRLWAALLADLPDGSPPVSLVALRTLGLSLADMRAWAGLDPHGLVRRVQEHASAVGAWALRARPVCALCVRCVRAVLCALRCAVW